MLWYIAKLLILIPFMGLLIWGSLKLSRAMQTRLSDLGGQRERSVKVIETSFLGPGLRLAVIEFRGREILLGCSKQGLTRLAEHDKPAGDL